jgi:REP element-mobilizing transposase RayT
MARPLRIEFPGAIYHVTRRSLGSWRSRQDRLFVDERDYARFLKRLEERVVDFGIRLYLFCLMSNHYHLVLETPRGNLSRFMQNLSTAYTLYFNRRHTRQGHVLDGRFKARLVSGDDYLLKLSRYVHQNPVWVSGWAMKPIAERIQALRAYRWSSYSGYIGQAPALRFVDYGPVLAMMSGRAEGQRRCYREFVETGLATSDEDFANALKASPSAIGDEGFQQWVEHIRRKAARNRRRPEDMAFGKVLEPVRVPAVLGTIAEVFGVEKQEFMRRRRNSPLRAVVGRYLTRFAGQTQRQVAGLLGMRTGAAVSAQIRRLPEAEARDKRLNKLIRQVETKLASIQDSLSLQVPGKQPRGKSIG